MKIIPRGNWVLVKPVEKESRQNKNGLLIPDNEELEQKAQGTVESVGEKIKDLKKGDKVIFGVFSGETVKTEDQEYKLLLDEDIIAFYKV